MFNRNKKNTKHFTVLQVLPHLNSGGSVSGAVEVAKALKKNNFKSVLVSSGGYKERELLRYDSILEYLPVNSKNIFKIFSNKKKLVKLIIKHNANIVHARSRAPAWAAFWAAKDLNIPFLTTFHGTYGLENIFKKKYNSIMLKGKEVIAISDFIKKHIKNEYNYKGKIHVIPRGVNTDIFSPTKVSSPRLINAAKKIKTEGFDKIILLPGRLTDWKGHRIAIQAVSNLRSKDFKLVILGDTQKRYKYKNKLINLAKELKLQNRIIFLDHTRDMPAFLMLSDLVLSCSTKPEAFGRTVLEAQAMGRPVVAFNHGGSVELVKNNQNGILSEVGNVNELTLNIEKNLNLSVNKRNLLAKKSIFNVKKKYLTEFMCKKTINLYRKIIKDFYNSEENTNN